MVKWLEGFFKSPILCDDGVFACYIQGRSKFFGKVTNLDTFAVKVVFFVVEKIVGRHVCLGFSKLLALLACEVTKSDVIHAFEKHSRLLFCCEKFYLTHFSWIRPVAQR